MGQPTARAKRATKPEVQEAAVLSAFADWAVGGSSTGLLRSLSSYLGVSTHLEEGRLVADGRVPAADKRKLLAALNRRAAQLSKTTQEIQARADMVRRMTVDLLDLEEAGRREMSRRLHDDAGQALVCIRLHMELLQQGDLDADLATKLGEIRDLTEQSILEIRRLISELSPRVLEQLGLAAAIRQFAGRLQTDYKVPVKVKLPKVVSLSRQLEIAVYRMIQDSALEFATRFSATNVNISLALADGVLSLKVSATGANQAGSETPEAKNSFRLKGIENRVALLGGKCELFGVRANEGVPGIRRKKSLEASIELPLNSAHA